MSKLYQMNRMTYSAAAGGLFTSVLGAAGKLVGKLFQSKATRAAIAAARKLAANPLAQTAVAAGAGAALGEAISSPGGKGRGASGGWTGRRRKGITATELRGFRKVSSLLHKEGMRIKKPGRRG
jgi:hypothetical protein